MMVGSRFRALGTDVELLVDGDTAELELELARAELERLEALVSRFRPDSELSRLNRAGALDVGPELRELVELALDARERTNGRFDPTVHDALASAGYDRSFELLDELVTVDAEAPPPCGGYVTVDRATSRVELERGYRLDLGGIAKGWCADRVVSLLTPAGPALVNAGGDLVAVGKPWPVGVETPTGTISLELEDAALATSGRDRRRWRANGSECHHLIDPATSRPADGELLTVTVAAPTAAEAEVLATSLFLVGDAAEAAAEADDLGAPTVLVTRGGSALLAGGLA